MTQRFLRTFVLMAVMLALALTASMQASVVAQDDPDCLGAEDYVRSVRTLQMAYSESLGDISPSDVENWSPEELETAIDATATYNQGLAAVTPPPAAVEVHTAISESFIVWLGLLEAVEEGGVLAALPYLETFNEVSAGLDNAGIVFEETCQIALVDNDDDGAPEIGAGNQPPPITSAEIDPNAPVGSFQNPIPVGTPEGVGGGWEITVVAVRPDDTQAVLDENSFNDEPIEGRQFFVADVTVRNVGSTPQTFDGNFRLRATGLEGDYRAFAPDDRCGVVANEWEEPEIAPGARWTPPGMAYPALAYMRVRFAPTAPARALRTRWHARVSSSA